MSLTHFRDLLQFLLVFWKPFSFKCSTQYSHKLNGRTTVCCKAIKETKIIAHEEFGASHYKQSECKVEKEEKSTD